MVIVGYGKYRSYRLQEIPESLLSELGGRYRLSHEAVSDADEEDLQLTIAIHEEIQRRKDGGAIAPRRPTARELAVKLVSKGFQMLSKDHHPDRGGSNEAQRALNAVRDTLLEACDHIQETEVDGALEIPEPFAESGPITDEDIPF
ncbi:MAG: hypothetical protein WBM24_01080 [Candidatus Sulfotelmatobacter sp.]